MKKITIYLIMACLLVSCRKETITEDITLATQMRLVTSEVYISDEDCSDVDWHGYPGQNPLQYLNPLQVLSSGKDHNVVYDHLVTRKVLNVFHYFTLCNIDLWIRNTIPTSPYYGEVIHFKNIYNWTDIKGNPLFNLNYELFIRWDLPSAQYTFPIKVLFMDTGEDASEGHDNVTLHFEGIDTVAYYF